MAKTFMHIGVCTDTPREGEVYSEGMKVHITPPPNEHSVEWLRWDADSTMPIELRTKTHIAFKVDDIEKECEGKKVIFPITEIAPGIRIAFVMDNELPVEYYEDKNG